MDEIHRFQPEHSVLFPFRRCENQALFQPRPCLTTEYASLRGKVVPVPTAQKTEAFTCRHPSNWRSCISRYCNTRRPLTTSHPSCPPSPRLMVQGQLRRPHVTRGASVHKSQKQIRAQSVKSRTSIHYSFCSTLQKTYYYHYSNQSPTM